MLIIREVFVARPGQASKLAAMMKKMNEMEPEMKSRVMTDSIADFNTVVVETEIDSLADYEKRMEDYMSKPHPEMEEIGKGYHEMFFTGKREIYRVV